MSNQLPFEDDVFDYVRMSALSRGIPENKARLPYDLRHTHAEQ